MANGWVDRLRRGVLAASDVWRTHRHAGRPPGPAGTTVPAGVVEAAFAEVLSDAAAADRAYDGLTGTAGGRVLNADAAMQLSPHYQTFDQRVSNARLAYGPASAYVRRRYDAAVTAPPPAGRPSPRRLLMLAGGPASGKTASVGERVLATYDLVFDSNLGDVAKAGAMIDLALGHGWEVTVLYVHRAFDRAVDSMVDRGMRLGRFISLHPDDAGNLAQLHWNAQQAILDLGRRYADVPGASVGAIWNLWPDMAADGRPTRAIPLAALAPGGPCHYDARNALYAAQAEALVRLRRDHGTSPGVLSALVGGR